MKKIIDGLCVVLAFVCIALGVIGIVLPLLPTTPFLLLALVLFAKGSKRCHEWFMGTLLYKKYLETYIGTKAMPMRAKRNILITMSILFAFGFVFSGVLWARIVIVTVWIGHFYFILVRIKTADKNKNRKEETKESPSKKKSTPTKLLSFFLIMGLMVYMLNGGWSNTDKSGLWKAKAQTELENGTYAIPVKLWHATNQAPSMGNGALHQTGKLMVEDNQATLYLYLLNFSLNGLNGNLMELNLLDNITLNNNNYPTSYDLISSSVISTYGKVDEYNAPDSLDSVSAGKFYPRVVAVPVTIDTEYTWAHVYVPIMGSLGFGDQLCKIKLDYKSVETMSQEQLEEWESYETSEEPDKDDDDDTITIDKSVLKEKIDTANTLLTQTDTYTQASLSNLKTAITTAQKAYDNATNQEAINAQVTVLQEAMEALVKKAEEILDKNQLADGKYNVYIDLWKAAADEASMGNAAIHHNALLTVKNKEYSISFSTRSMTLGTITACLQSVWIQQLDKTYQEAEITAKNNTLNGGVAPSVFSFVLPSKEEYLNVKIDPKVEIMGNEPLEARLKISWDTLTKIADDAVIEEKNDSVVNEEEWPALKLTDKKTKVKVEAQKNILVEGATMKVSKLESGTDYESVKALLLDVATSFISYDIALLSASGAKVEPNGMIHIYLPLPEDYNQDSIAIYRIKDGVKSKITATQKDGYGVFETSSVGTFAIADTSTVKKSTLPTTKKSGTLPKKSTSSTVKKKSTNLTGTGKNSTLKGASGQTNMEQEQLDAPVSEQTIQINNPFPMNQMLTIVMLACAMLGSILIMLFVIGFILTHSLLRRKK